MSVILGKLLDRGGIVRLNLVIRFIFIYTRENFCLKCECWSVKKYQHCRLIWKLCIVCEAVLKKAIAETLTEMVLLFMITVISKSCKYINIWFKYINMIDTKFIYIYIYIHIYIYIILTYQKVLLHTLLLFVFKIVEYLQCILFLKHKVK